MSWSDSEISLEFDAENLRQLLLQGQKGTQSNYCHFQIVRWCGLLVQYLRQQDNLHPLIDIADDVVVQWELHLATNYTVTQMDKFSQSDLVLPKQHFSHWLKLLDRHNHV
ncbi:hypothetical protein [Gynuella sunshinyii]|uniref:Uncharacterized protein n=1 Tax=Gynuella sunshinyii YC6258 TaxID=1445510 RepID=A0A0C5W1A7_9GAMM|nr:hypothetical protein [Gynuella sunshinyii]AJQ96469.1 hypothetical Protein YC6258_04437 [Gynuella sunshinyii YC6258]